MFERGIREVAVCGNRETNLLRSRLNRFAPAGMRVSYHEDPMPRGAAGAARDAALATSAQTFVIAEGTAIPNLDLGDLLAKHRESGARLTLVIHTETRRTDDRPVHVPSGIYVFERSAFELVPARGFCDIKETLIPALNAAGQRVLPYAAATAAPQVLNAATYMAVNDWVIEGLVRSNEELVGYHRSSQGLVHRDAYIARDASIIGPVLIGPGARILSGAVIVGPTSIGREATIEPGAMVSRSAIWRRAVVGECATVDRSIVGDDAVVAAETQALRGVVVADRKPEPTHSVSAPTVYATRTSASDIASRLGRLVFGAGWSRSPAAQ
jgi:NDP-sugar pyrophosphorylase family protein